METFHPLPFLTQKMQGGKNNKIWNRVYNFFSPVDSWFKINLGYQSGKVIIRYHSWSVTCTGEISYRLRSFCLSADRQLHLIQNSSAASWVVLQQPGTSWPWKQDSSQGANTHSTRSVKVWRRNSAPLAGMQILPLPLKMRQKGQGWLMAIVVRAVAWEQRPHVSFTITLTCPVQCLGS